MRIETQRDLWQGPDAIGRRFTMDGLTEVDESGEARPALAVQWSSQSGDRHWEFRLRANVRFHDGSPLSAESVVASLTASCVDDCPWKTVRAAGQSVVFACDSPAPDLPAELSLARFLISRQRGGGVPVAPAPSALPSRQTAR